MTDQKTVVFKLNNQLCGAYTSQVSEIIRYQEVSKIPRQPRFIEGVTNFRGRIIPIVNLNRRFELGEMEITKKTKIIITEVGEAAVGFIVNDVTEIINFSEEDIEPAPAVVLNESASYLKSIGKKGDQLVSILDLSKILNDNELKKASKIS